MNNKVVYDYDRQGDSLFIYCVEDYEYEVSLELDNDVILDIDKDGKPVAFEFLNASKIFNLDKTYFNNLSKITIQSNITEEAINLKVQLIVPIHNKTQTFGMNRITTNLNGIPAMESELVTA
ncbi:MAG: DUF2283 domain-containing protein [Methanobrevibacter sp.]|uniref:DUF2283 domain-containing protein n=1 Tax=Methanobrevibacter sp. TaxID=66852 RepID=UPI0025F1090A|nr:DUF2283 domain-containing protein [Methanobrevibacter sp.]MBQ6099217.1 DUF2283 domain-containing protein [Methanobrevibacter sp.]